MLSLYIYLKQFLNDKPSELMYTSSFFRCSPKSIFESSKNVIILAVGFVSFQYPILFDAVMVTRAVRIVYI